MPRIKQGKKVTKRKGPSKPKDRSNDLTRHSSKTNTKPSRPSNGRGMAGNHSAQAMAVCSLSNPFCDGAIGSRYADAAAHRSLPYTVRFAVPLGTGTGGGGMVAFKAAPDGIYTLTASGATDAPTTPAAWVFAGGPPSGWDDARLTSWGVKGVNTIEPMNSAGMMRVITLNEPPLVNTAFNLTLYTYDSVETYPSAPGTTFHWISKPANAIQTRRFLPPATTVTGDTADVNLSGWQAVVFAAVGQKVSTPACYYLECVAHYEFTVKPADALVPYQRPSPVPVPAVTDAVKRLAQTAPQTQWNKTDTGVDEWFKTAAKGALSYGMKAAGEWATSEAGAAALSEGFGMLFG